MIVDLILDRYDGKPYNPMEFYREVREYDNECKGLGERILKALDSKEEIDVRRELNNYIVGNDYSPTICVFINYVKWLVPDDGNSYVLLHQMSRVIESLFEQELEHYE